MGAGISNAAGQIRTLILDTAAQLQARGLSPHVFATLRGMAAAGDGLGSVYAVRPGDTSTADDGWSTLVDAAGRRWFRLGIDSASQNSITAVSSAAVATLSLICKSSGEVRLLSTTRPNFISVQPSLSGTPVILRARTTTDPTVPLSLQSYGLGQVQLSANNAVNYLAAQPTIAAGTPSLIAQGADTNVSLALSAKGSGSLLLTSDTAANYLSVIPAATGVAPALLATGSDSNVSLNLAGKGSGGISLTNGLFGNYVAVTPVATGGLPLIAAAGVDANSTLAIIGKGAAGVILGNSGSQWGVRLNSNQAAGLVEVAASSRDGSAVNSDLALTPLGTGLVRINYASAAATTPANFTATRYIAIKDGGGTTYYVPCRATVW